MGTYVDPEIDPELVPIPTITADNLPAVRSGGLRPLPELSGTVEQTVHVVDDSTGWAIVVDGDGSELHFQSVDGGATYTSPTGAFSVLVRNEEGHFVRTLPDKTVYELDGENRLLNQGLFEFVTKGSISAKGNLKIKIRDSGKGNST